VQGIALCRLKVRNAPFLTDIRQRTLADRSIVYSNPEWTISLSDAPWKKKKNIITAAQNAWVWVKRSRGEFRTANSIGCETDSILYHIYTHGKKRGIDCKQCVLFVLHQRGRTQELSEQHDYSGVARERPLHSTTNYWYSHIQMVLPKITIYEITALTNM